MRKIGFVVVLLQDLLRVPGYFLFYISFKISRFSRAMIRFSSREI